MPGLSVAFVAGDSGTWSVERLETVSGEPLAWAPGWRFSKESERELRSQMRPGSSAG
jgi:hypothetical protein